MPLHILNIAASRVSDNYDDKTHQSNIAKVPEKLGLAQFKNTIKRKKFQLVYEMTNRIRRTGKLQKVPEKVGTTRTCTNPTKCHETNHNDDDDNNNNENTRKKKTNLSGKCKEREDITIKPKKLKLMFGLVRSRQTGGERETQRMSTIPNVNKRL